MNENEFLIELQAKLDEEKSKGNINKDLDKIQKTLNTLKLQAEIDSDTINKLTRQLEGIISQKIVISNIDINPTNASDSAQNLGKRIGNDIKNSVKKSLSIDDVINSALNRMSQLTGRDLNKLFANRLNGVSNILKNNSDLMKLFNDSISKTYNPTSLNGLISVLKNAQKEMLSTEEIAKRFSSIISSQFMTKIPSSQEMNDSIFEISKALKQFHTETENVGGQTSGENLFKWISNNATQAQKDILKVSDGFDAFQKLLNGFSYNNNDLINYTTTLDLDVLNYNIDGIEKFIKSQSRLVAESNVAEKELQDLRNVLISLFEIDTNSDGTLSVTLEQLQSIVSQYPQAKKYIAEINSSLIQIPQADQNIIASSSTATNEIVQNEEKKQQAIQMTADVASKVSLDNSGEKLGNFKESLKNIGMEANEIDLIANKITQLNIGIDSLNQTVSSGDKNILKVSISGVDEYGQAIKLIQEYNMETGKLVKSIDSVSTIQHKAGVAIDTFNDKVKNSVTNQTNSLNKIYRQAIDPNSSKPIKDESNLSLIKNKYDEITSAIARMGEATKDNFTDEQNIVKSLISDIQILIRECKNAETVATSLRSKDIDTVKSQYSSKLDVLVTKMKSSGVYTGGFQNGTENLRNLLNNTIEASGLTAFLNGLDKLEAGYKRVAASKKLFNQQQSVKLNVSGLQSDIANLQRISPEINNFTVQLDKADVSVQSLLKDLEQVSTKDDFNIVKKKVDSFTKAAKSAGIAVSDVFQQSNLKSQAKQLYSEISKTAKELNSLQVKQTKLDPNTDFNQWQELSEQIDNVIIKYDKLQNEFWSNPDYSSYFTIGDFTDLDSKFQKAIDSINTYKAKMQDALTVQSSEIEFSIDNGHGVSQYQNRINGLIKDFQKYGVSVESAKTQTESLQKIFNDMKGLSGQELINQAGKFEQEFKAVKISIEEAKLSYDELLQPITSTQQVNLTNKIEKWLMNNTRATKSARSELKLYLKELESGDVTKGRYIDIENTFTNIDTHMRSLGKIGKSFFQTMTDGAKKFSYWFSSTMIIMKTINAIRQAIGTVKELDTSLVDLKKTAQMSSSELNNFYLSANDTAKQMGVTTKQIIDQAAAWSRLN